MVASQGLADELARATIDEAWAKKLLIEKDLKLSGDIAGFDGHRLTGWRFVFGVGEASSGKEENGGDEVFHFDDWHLARGIGCGWRYLEKWISARIHVLKTFKNSRRWGIWAGGSSSRMGLCEIFHKFTCPVGSSIAIVVSVVRCMIVGFLSSIVLLGLNGCGPRVSDRNIDALNAQIDAGRTLSVKEVESILGQPSRQELRQVERQVTREVPFLRYFYTEGGQTVELQFLDNKLQNRPTHFTEKSSLGRLPRVNQPPASTAPTL